MVDEHISLVIYLLFTILPIGFGIYLIVTGVRAIMREESSYRLHYSLWLEKKVVNGKRAVVMGVWRCFIGIISVCFGVASFMIT